jgi:potassium/sodium efflux P-type ATPase
MVQGDSDGQGVAEVVRSVSREGAELARRISREAVQKASSPKPTSLLDDPGASVDRASPEFYEKAPTEEVVRELDVDVARGLTASMAAEKLRTDGPNELEKSKRPGFLVLFLMQLMNLIIVLLILAAIASFAVGSIPSGAAIIVIVILNAGIAAATENSAGSALEALSKMSQPEALVLRDGEEGPVPSSCVVRGDVVILGTGDVIPADMRLLEAADMKVDEMPLTGESEDVAKSAKQRSADTGKLTPEHMLYSGCSVTSGSARGIVVATGMRTRVGGIAALLAGKKKTGRCGGLLPDTSSGMTPLQASLQRLSMLIGALAIFVCVAVFIVGLALGTENPNNAKMAGWMYMVLVSITLTVAAIPEGIPLCVTISLSSGCSAMVSRNVLVRRIAAVETLGSASVICSDKTGTLTEGKMRAVKMWSAGVDYEISGKGFDPTSGVVYRANAANADTANAASDATVRSTLLPALLCSNARVEREEGEDGEEKWVPHGNSSEVPIVVAAGKVGLTAAGLREAFPRMEEVPFSSTRKMMLTVCGASAEAARDNCGLALPESTRMLACIKGAPNYVMDSCKSWVGPQGGIEHFSDEAREEACRTIDALSSQALRVLAIAVRPLHELPYDANEDVSADMKMGTLCQDLTLVGLVASIDPPRQGVREAVQAAHEGHLRVMMITGDYLKTAAAIARDVGILGSTDTDASALDCTTLRPSGEYLEAAQIDALTAEARVFARAKPEDKLEIVKSLQRQGLVSAMTGDGVNDAPALNAADIGVAMGIQGTEVAKGASDMILTDDNFCSIVGAVEKGRVIYAGIQKFVAFIMSVHIAEVLQIFVCIVAEVPVMRTPLQILYLILVTDLAPSIALGLEPGQAGIMRDRPRPKEQPILLGWMWQSTVVNSVILAGIIMSVYLWALDYYVHEMNVDNIASLVQEDSDNKIALQKAQTVAFISLVWSENIRAYTSRSFDRPVCSEMCTNWAMQRAIGIAQAALYVAVFLPGLSDVLGLQGFRIGLEGWLAALVGAVACLVLCEAYKAVLHAQRTLLAGERLGSKGQSMPREVEATKV